MQDFLNGHRRRQSRRRGDHPDEPQKHEMSMLQKLQSEVVPEPFFDSWTQCRESSSEVQELWKHLHFYGRIEQNESRAIHEPNKNSIR